MEKEKKNKSPKVCLRKVRKAVKLHEIYEGVQFVSIMSIAERIVRLKSKATFKQPLTNAEWQWLRLTCENQSVMRKLSRAYSSYIHYNGNWNDVDSELLRSGGTCAEAHNFLKDIKQYMDDMARTQVLQATDEVMNSEEMAEIAKQQAFIDLQNSYTEEQTDSAKRVSSLASLAVDI